MVKPGRLKSPDQSRIVKTEIVCPNDTNPMGILQGGRLVHWMDMAAAVCAQTHAERSCVTAAIEKVSFRLPVRVGDIVRIEAKVTRVFTTSMEVYVQACTQAFGNDSQSVSESWFTFVALDEEQKPTRVMPIVPGTEEEAILFNDAGNRKSKR